MTMARRSDSRDDPLPLLVWRELSEIENLQAERDALASRIARLRPHAHYRIELETRLRALTARQIELDCMLRGRAVAPSCPEETGARAARGADGGRR